MHDIDRTLTELDIRDRRLREYSKPTNSRPMNSSSTANPTRRPIPRRRRFRNVPSMKWRRPALATELLSVQSEEELDIFIGKRSSRRGGVKKVAGGIARPLGGILKGVAKKALAVRGWSARLVHSDSRSGHGSRDRGGWSVEQSARDGTGRGRAAKSASSKWRAGSCVWQARRRNRPRRRRLDCRPGCRRRSRLSSPPPTAVVPAMKAARRGGSGPGSRGRRGRWVRRGSKIIVMGV